MKPREIDALIAEKVMEWEIYSDSSTPYVLDRDDLRRYVGYIESVYCFNPSENIADAWEVVEKTDVLEFNDFLTYSKIDGGWIIGIIDSYGDLGIWANADTAPMAICLAALRCKGIEVND